MRTALPLLLTLLFLGACGGAPKPSPLVTAPAYSLAEARGLPKTLRLPLTKEKGYLFIESSVNGRRAGKMLFDTGSTLNIIDRGVVNRFGLEQTGEGRTIGIAGAETFTRHAVDSLAIAGLDLGVDQAGSLSMVRLTRGLRVSPAGLIGSVSLLPHPFTIDYTKGELIVYNRKTFVPPEGAQKVALRSYGGLPAVRARLDGGQDVLLILDTGMGGAVALPMACADWNILATGASGAGRARGVGGEIQTTQGWLRGLGLFGYKLGGVPVTFEPNPKARRSSLMQVGRVGGQVLKGFRMTFDARYSALWVEFAGPAN